MQKLLIILAAALSLTAIALGYVNRTHLLTERAARVAAEADRDSAAKMTAKNASELKATQDKLTAMTSDQEKAVADLAEFKARSEKSSADQGDLQKQLIQKDSDIAQNKTDLAAKDARIAELEAKISAAAQPAPQQYDEKKLLEEKEILTTSLQNKLKEAESQLAALRQRESDRKSKVMRVGLEGTVLAVNPSWNFVVLSLGDRNGVVNNSELLIKRGSQLVGKVRVTSVEPSTSVADIVVNSVQKGLSVQPGDTVIYQGPESDSDSK
jgi:predicted RNase H-like nuclease (RuvC/YqgF family)